MSIRSYRDLRVWQEAMALAELVYRVTKLFPRDEMFGLTSQMRRACVSIPANIAEGYGRESAGAYQQFLRIAQGSVKELETHALIACRVGMVGEEETAGLLSKTEAVGKMLRALIRSLDV
ncbi:four helix bundle protein [Bosea sp. Leaf344]|uniref:four helix bundle protein n=1 Tax=Bosea sp. Leaf344 TaxID=1736346 RepID=UPI0007016861|nr:four helix bundle protein [Bosea sp. Leaf344]KQU50890.1 four helix bundle protein [Bosea sp. Leaf344]